MFDRCLLQSYAFPHSFWEIGTFRNRLSLILEWIRNIYIYLYIWFVLFSLLELIGFTFAYILKLLSSLGNVCHFLTCFPKAFNFCKCIRWSQIFSVSFSAFSRCPSCWRWLWRTDWWGVRTDCCVESPSNTEDQPSLVVVWDVSGHHFTRRTEAGICMKTVKAPGFVPSIDSDTFNKTLQLLCSNSQIVALLIFGWLFDFDIKYTVIVSKFQNDSLTALLLFISIPSSV